MSRSTLAVFGAIVVALGSVRQINQWETGLKFTLGKLTGRATPGLSFVGRKYALFRGKCSRPREACRQRRRGRQSEPARHQAAAAEINASRRNFRCPNVRGLAD